MLLPGRFNDFFDDVDWTGDEIGALVLDFSPLTFFFPDGEMK